MKKVKLKAALKKPQINLFIQKNSILLVFEAVGILLAVGYLVYNNVLAGLIFFPYIFWHVRKRRAGIIQKKKTELAKSFKDGMQAVVSALAAGYSIENAFREALGEIELLYGKKAVIYLGFADIVRQLCLNVNIEDAMNLFAKECDVEEITSFAEILYYAKRSGGNLIEIIKNTAATIGEKIEVGCEIQTIISAKKLEQNIMNLVPVGIILYMRMTSGGMFDKLYGNLIGISVMTVCLIMYFIARLIADRIVEIKV